MGRTPRRRRRRSCSSPAASSPRRAAATASPPWMMDGTRRKETAAPPAPARVTQQKPPPESNTCQSRGGGTQTAKLAGRAPKTKSTNETNMDRRRCTCATNHKKEIGEREKAQEAQGDSTVPTCKGTWARDRRRGAREIWGWEVMIPAVRGCPYTNMIQSNNTTPAAMETRRAREFGNRRGHARNTASPEDVGRPRGGSWDEMGRAAPDGEAGGVG